MGLLHCLPFTVVVDICAGVVLLVLATIEARVEAHLAVINSARTLNLEGWFISILSPRWGWIQSPSCRGGRGSGEDAQAQELDSGMQP